MIDITEKAKKSALDKKELSERVMQFITELNGEQDQSQLEEINPKIQA